MEPKGTTMPAPRSSAPKNIPLLTAMACRGQTGRSIARVARLHPNTVYRALNNRGPITAANAAAIARVLDASPAELGLTTGAGGAE